MSHPFGDLLGQFLHRKHGLSQFKLADGINQPASVISEMCQGKRLTGRQARGRVVSILLWLHQQGAVYTKEEANALLEAAGASFLHEGVKAEAELLQRFHQTVLQDPLQHKETPSTHLSNFRLFQDRSTSAPRHNLPVQSTPLIGREMDANNVVEMLNQPDCRLLTVSGQGGIGKTRLAIQVATQIAEQSAQKFPDGIFFTSLQPATGPAFLAQAILDAIGLPIYGTDDPRKVLVQFLREQRLLLVLDNFEEVLQNSAENTAATLEFLAMIVQQAPQVKTLITSRFVLNLSGEWIYLLKGLSYPPSNREGTVVTPPGQVDVNQYSAVRLFIERARHVQHHFSADHEMTGIIQICQVVEGLPLALEMAATWTKMMTCADIAATIQRSLTFLETRYQDVPARHRSVLAVINQSWQALSPVECQVYAKLSVFKGGFQRQAAEQVAGASLSILSSLVDKSFLRWEPEDRYQIQELLRQFAHEQLQSDAQTLKRTYTLHCLYYADFLGEYSAGITGVRQQDLIRRISVELQNIRAAWRQAVDDSNLQALQQAAYTYYEFCDFTSRYLEGAEAFELAVGRLVETEVHRQSAEVLAVLYPLLGYHYIRLGKFDNAKKSFFAGQEILRNFLLPIKPGFGTDPVTGMGLLALVTGDYSAANQYAQSGRDASLLRNDPLNLQIALYILANAAFSLGEYDLALSHIEQGLASTEKTGNQFMKGQILTVQGQIAQAQHQYALAQEKYQESYRILQEFNDLEGEANALKHLARIVLMQGKPQDAQQLFQKSMDIFLRIDNPGGLGSTYASLGDSEIANGDIANACRYYLQGLQIALQIQWLPLTILLLTGIGELLVQSGRAKQSAELLTQVLAHPATTKDVRVRALQSLEHALSQLQSQSDTVVMTEPAPEKVDDGIWHTSRTLLVELSGLAMPNNQAESRQKRDRISGGISLRDGLLDPLTAREMDILRLIAQGNSNQQIADALGLALGTIKWYSQQIYQKLGVGNRTQAVARAREIHLLE